MQKQQSKKSIQKARTRIPKTAKPHKISPALKVGLALLIGATLALKVVTLIYYQAELYTDYSQNDFSSITEIIGFAIFLASLPLLIAGYVNTKHIKEIGNNLASIILACVYFLVNANNYFLSGPVGDQFGSILIFLSISLPLIFLILVFMVLGHKQYPNNTLLKLNFAMLLLMLLLSPAVRLTVAFINSYL